MVIIDTNNESLKRHMEEIRKELLEDIIKKGHYDTTDFYLVRTTDFLEYGHVIHPICDVPFFVKNNPIIRNVITDTKVVSGHGSTTGETNFTTTDKIYLLTPQEIYSNFEIKDTELLLQSEYPTYNKKQIYNDITKEIDNMLEYITLFRNKKLENKISNDIEIIDYNKNTLLNKMLKLEDKIVEIPTYKDKLTIELYSYKFDIYFDNSKNSEEEKQKIQEEILKLEVSIERRKKLLSNENYVNKAPEAIVNKEREDLAKEEHKLEILRKN